MSLIRIEKNPSGRQLLVFAAAWLGFAGAAGWACWTRHHRPAAELLWVAAVLIPLGGLVHRNVLRVAFLGLSYATYPIGLVVSFFVLAAVYFLALMPIGLTMRILGRDPLSRKFDSASKSYWTKRDKAKSAESYFKQS